MSSLYCSQGHPNASGSRFCNWCGEKMPSLANYQGTVLGDRYQIVQELGHGGFGRTYLADDLNRFKEPCVLKEFAPQVQGTYALQKAEELFQREAGVLHQLRHPQIPRFRELFRTTFENNPRLFLVQDYVSGQNYRQLLDARRSQGLLFSEAEVMQLMLNLLPVLEYIHGIGVVHRDISPENLILRTADQMPVLIDFGGVKQVAASVASQYISGDGVPTRVGKVGYAPNEQMELGRVSSHSDLYALAVTVLVLLSGKEPADFLGEMKTSSWQQRLTLSPQFQSILAQMLAVSPQQRYQSAVEVMQALRRVPGIAQGTPQGTSQGTFQGAPQGVFQGTFQGTPLGLVGSSAPDRMAAPLAALSNLATQAIAPRSPQPQSAYVPAAAPIPHVPEAPHPGTLSTAAPSARRQPGLDGCLPVVLSVLIAAGVGSAVWWTRDVWLSLLPGSDPAEPTETTAPKPDSDFSAEEKARKAALNARRQELGIDSAYWVKLTDTTFHQRYLELKGRSLSKDPDDASWRQRWDAIAAEWLDLFERNLTSDARRKLGNYRESDRTAWQAAVNRLNVSSRALNDLADAKFFSLFPQARGQNFINRPIGQVWQAIAADQVTGLQSGKALKTIQFKSGELAQTLSATLKPGEGRVYIANLSAGQPTRLSLDVAKNTTLLSIYVPNPTPQLPTLLEDATQTRWSETLPQSGYYEFVIVSNSQDPVQYRLDLAVDRTVTTPISPDSKLEPYNGEPTVGPDN